MTSSAQDYLVVTSCPGLVGTVAIDRHETYEDRPRLSLPKFFSVDHHVDGVSPVEEVAQAFDLPGTYEGLHHSSRQSVCSAAHQIGLVDLV